MCKTRPRLSLDDAINYALDRCEERAVDIVLTKPEICVEILKMLEELSEPLSDHIGESRRGPELNSDHAHNNPLTRRMYLSRYEDDRCDDQHAYDDGIWSI